MVYACTCAVLASSISAADHPMQRDVVEIDMRFLPIDTRGGILLRHSWHSVCKKLQITIKL